MLLIVETKVAVNTDGDSGFERCGAASPQSLERAFEAHTGDKQLLQEKSGLRDYG